MKAFPQREWSYRLNRVRQLMSKRGIDIILIHSHSSIDLFYLSGYDTPQNSLLVLPLNGEPSLFLGTQWDLRRASKVSYISQIFVSEHPIENAANFLMEQIKGAKIGVVGLEIIPFSIYNQLTECFSRAQIVSASGLIKNIRLVKSQWEINALRKAVEIAERGMSAVIKTVYPGKKECAIAKMAHIAMKKAGAEKLPFQAIIASGENSAMPLVWPTERTIRKSDLVVVDLSATYRGYYSDVCRTIIMGEASKEQKKFYHLVLEAQRLALSIIKPGQLATSVHKIVQDFFTDAGCGEYFLHRAGHGLGLDPDEFDLQREHLELVPGMVFTIEPGIYIEGIGGIRIEDEVLVTHSGCQILSKFDKDFERMVIM